MTYRLKAQGMWRAMRNGLAGLNRLLAEPGRSDEDLVFHVRCSEPENPLLDRNRERLVSQSHASGG